MSSLRASTVVLGAVSLGLATLTPQIAADTSGLSSGRAAAGVQPVMTATSRGRITFTQPNAATGKSAVCVMDANGRRVRLLTEGMLVEPGPGPKWSPDGRLILFTQDMPRSVWVVAVDSGRAVRLTDSDAGAPAWSPDGRRIAYVGSGDRKPYGQLFVMDADGANQHQLSNVPSRIVSLAWSPDGRRIAFSTRSQDRYVMRSDGTNLQRLPGSGRMLGLVWSPDGRRLAWATVSGVSVLDLRSGRDRALTEGPADSPAWSPDGRWIAFSVNVVSVVRADGGNVRSLHPGYDPDWSPDGQRIAFRDDGSVKVMDAHGREVRTLGKGYAPGWFGPAPTRTTVNAAPEPVAKGKPLAVFGTVTKVGIGLYGATVQIRFKAAGARRYTMVGATTTDANGRFNTTVTARRTGTWKAVHPATAATFTSHGTDKVKIRR